MISNVRYDIDPVLRRRLEVMTRDEQAGVLWKTIRAMEQKVEFGHPGALEFFQVLEMLMKYEPAERAS